MWYISSSKFKSKQIMGLGTLIYPSKKVDVHEFIKSFKLFKPFKWGGGPTLFLSVDFVNILPKTGGGQTLMFTKALTKF